MKRFFLNYQEGILYLFFGVATTVVNYLVYFVFREYFSFNYLFVNFLAWFCSVLFAFVTNKLWVFRSKNRSRKDLLREVVLFYWYRILSLGIDMISMWLLVSIMNQSEFLSKTFTQVLIVALNYVFSKAFIFKKNGSEGEK